MDAHAQTVTPNVPASVLYTDSTLLELKLVLVLVNQYFLENCYRYLYVIQM